MADLLSLPRMARQLGVTQQWLRNQAKMRLVPCLRAGSRFLFNPEAVEKVLLAQAARPQEGGEEDAD